MHGHIHEKINRPAEESNNSSTSLKTETSPITPDLSESATGVSGGPENSKSFKSMQARGKVEISGRGDNEPTSEQLMVSSTRDTRYTKNLEGDLNVSTESSSPALSTPLPSSKKIDISKGFGSIRTAPTVAASTSPTNGWRYTGDETSIWEFISRLLSNVRQSLSAAASDNFEAEAAPSTPSTSASMSSKTDDWRSRERGEILALLDLDSLGSSMGSSSASSPADISTDEEYSAGDASELDSTLTATVPSVVIPSAQENPTASKLTSTASTTTSRATPVSSTKNLRPESNEVFQEHSLCRHSWTRPLGLLNLCPENFPRDLPHRTVQINVSPNYSVTRTLRKYARTSWATAFDTFTEIATENRTVYDTITSTTTEQEIQWVPTTLTAISSTTIWREETSTIIIPLTTLETSTSTLIETIWKQVTQPVSFVSQNGTTALAPTTTTQTVTREKTTVKTVTDHVTHTVRVNAIDINGLGWHGELPNFHTHEKLFWMWAKYVILPSFTVVGMLLLYRPLLWLYWLIMGKYQFDAFTRWHDYLFGGVGGDGDDPPNNGPANGNNLSSDDSGSCDGNDDVPPVGADSEENDPDSGLHRKYDPADRNQPPTNELMEILDDIDNDTTLGHEVMIDTGTGQEEDIWKDVPDSSDKKFGSNSETSLSLTSNTAGMGLSAEESNPLPTQQPSSPEAGGTPTNASYRKFLKQHSKKEVGGQLSHTTLMDVNASDTMPANGGRKELEQSLVDELENTFTSQQIPSYGASTVLEEGSTTLRLASTQPTPSPNALPPHSQQLASNNPSTLSTQGSPSSPSSIHSISNPRPQKFEDSPSKMSESPGVQNKLALSIIDQSPSRNSFTVPDLSSSTPTPERTQMYQQELLKQSPTSFTLLKDASTKLMPPAKYALLRAGSFDTPLPKPKSASKQEYLVKSSAMAWTESSENFALPQSAYSASPASTDIPSSINGSLPRFDQSLRGQVTDLEVEQSSTQQDAAAESLILDQSSQQASPDGSPLHLASLPTGDSFVKLDQLPVNQEASDTKDNSLCRSGSEEQVFALLDLISYATNLHEVRSRAEGETLRLLNSYDIFLDAEKRGVLEELTAGWTVEMMEERCHWVRSALNKSGLSIDTSPKQQLHNDTEEKPWLTENAETADMYGAHPNADDNNDVRLSANPISEYWLGTQPTQPEVRETLEMNKGHKQGNEAEFMLSPEADTRPQQEQFVEEGAYAFEPKRSAADPSYQFNSCSESQRDQTKGTFAQQAKAASPVHDGQKVPFAVQNSLVQQQTLWQRRQRQKQQKQRQKQKQRKKQQHQSEPQITEASILPLEVNTMLNSTTGGRVPTISASSNAEGGEPRPKASEEGNIILTEDEDQDDGHNNAEKAEALMQISHIEMRIAKQETNFKKYPKNRILTAKISKKIAELQDNLREQRQRAGLTTEDDRQNPTSRPDDIRQRKSTTSVPSTAGDEADDGDCDEAKAWIGSDRIGTSQAEPTMTGVNATTDHDMTDVDAQGDESENLDSSTTGGPVSAMGPAEIKANMPTDVVMPDVLIPDDFHDGAGVSALDRLSKASHIGSKPYEAVVSEDASDEEQEADVSMHVDTGGLEYRALTSSYVAESLKTDKLTVRPSQESASTSQQQVDYSKRTIFELQRILKFRGLRSTGTKKGMIARLKEADKTSV
ncbi:hypothetical protein H2198_009731 [Neophaeococcomyces mojaviensis]|uniref:Uncharacterized protein n=1 Tax=Neophaeococcomyces mojaviensis TaxID=3383035 RepID=A0ACC2ZTU6_9EURO|nr:hypothetical protein H2198_009731 [Knufia sp. JES_112]